jgi:hypothetical protein
VKTHFREIKTGVYGFSVDGEVPENSTLVIDPTSIRQCGTYYWGLSTENCRSVSVDNSHNVILAGFTYSYSNIASTGAYDTADLILSEDYAHRWTFEDLGHLLWWMVDRLGI